jgi:hypothetical protein
MRLAVNWAEEVSGSSIGEASQSAVRGVGQQHLIVLISPLADGENEGPVFGSRHRPSIDRLRLKRELLAPSTWLGDTMQLIGVSETCGDEQPLSIGIPSPKSGAADRLVLSQAFW